MSPSESLSAANALVVVHLAGVLVLVGIRSVVAGYTELIIIVAVEDHDALEAIIVYGCSSCPGGILTGSHTSAPTAWARSVCSRCRGQAARVTMLARQSCRFHATIAQALSVQKSQ